MSPRSRLSKVHVESRLLVLASALGSVSVLVSVLLHSFLAADFAQPKKQAADYMARDTQILLQGTLSDPNERACASDNMRARSRNDKRNFTH